MGAPIDMDLVLAVAHSSSPGLAGTVSGLRDLAAEEGQSKGGTTDLLFLSQVEI